MTLSIKHCPPAGSGVHRWLLSAANSCRHFGLSEADTFDFLEEKSRNCGRTVSHSEIRDAIRTAYQSASIPGRPGLVSPKPNSGWPSTNLAKVSSIVAGGFGLRDLRAESPSLPESLSTEGVIDQIIPGNPYICVARKKPADSRTLPREVWRGRLSDSSLIVPSPMSSPMGTTKDGRRSPRCLDNVGPRRFLVVEFDSGTLDSQAARLWHLAERMPFVLAVHSGGKSIHGWYFVAGTPENHLLGFMRFAVMLGADQATWTRCQLVRMPGGLRDNGQRQMILYFNPYVIAPRVSPVVSDPDKIEVRASQP